MYKIIIVLLTALVLEAIGVVFLKKGIVEIGDLREVSAPEMFRLVKSGVTNPAILTGILFEALFFCGLLYLMSQADVSFVWPMTSLGFVITPIAAHYILREQVSGTRWLGIILIVGGAAVISWSEQAKPKPPVQFPTPASQTTAAAASQKPVV